MTKERPILFSGEMVRALLAGTKTQTRRAIRVPAGYIMDERDDGMPWPWYASHAQGDTEIPWLRCPYGEPGDLLWVRETHASTAQAGDHAADARTVYRATDPDWSTMEGWKWKPSIFMRRADSRIILRVTSVRVERVQDISEADACAEGVDSVSLADVPRPAAWSRRQDFSRLWVSINGAESWEANPWVWVVGFERVTIEPWDTRKGAEDAA